MMTNEERNTALYQKMFAEQEVFRDWLKGHSPEEILNHAYEYTVREDILLSLEYHDLSDDQADALMKSPSPLADVFQDFEKLETSHMETVWDCLEGRADTLLEEQRRTLRETPVYPYPASYAHEHGELNQYRTSNEANMACKKPLREPSVTITEGTVWMEKQQSQRLCVPLERSEPCTSLPTPSGKRTGMDGFLPAIRIGRNQSPFRRIQMSGAKTGMSILS